VQKTQPILSKTQRFFAEKIASESFDIFCTLTVGNKPLFATEIIVNSNSTPFSHLQQASLSSCTASFFSICLGNHSLILLYLSFFCRRKPCQIVPYGTFLLYLPRESLLNLTVPFFYIWRGNPCKMVPYLSSTVFLPPKIHVTYGTFFYICRRIPSPIVPPYHTFLLYLPKDTLSNLTLPFVYVCRGNPWQTVPYFSSSVADPDPRP
jgi:hypothetical protein